MKKLNKKDLLKLDILALNVPKRIFFSLHGNGIKTIGNLCEKSKRDLLLVRNFGIKSLSQVRIALSKLNLKLKYDTHDICPFCGSEKT